MTNIQIITINPQIFINLFLYYFMNFARCFNYITALALKNKINFPIFIFKFVIVIFHDSWQLFY